MRDSGSKSVAIAELNDYLTLVEALYGYCLNTRNPLQTYSSFESIRLRNYLTYLDARHLDISITTIPERPFISTKGWRNELYNADLSLSFSELQPDDTRVPITTGSSRPFRILYFKHLNSTSVALVILALCAFISIVTTRIKFRRILLDIIRFPMATDLSVISLIPRLPMELSALLEIIPAIPGADLKLLFKASLVATHVDLLLKALFVPILMVRTRPRSAAISYSHIMVNR